ncbi:MAG: hypothetical protein ACRDD8_10370 [Bacteroidales bacterium]
MKMNIKHRLSFLQLLQDGEGFVSKFVTASLREKLNLSVDEIDNCKIRDTESGVEWSDNVYTKDIQFANCEIKVLQDIVKLLEEHDKIDFENFEICEEIMNQGVV